ncbi:MAG: hypothetical protein AB1641_03200 [Thermodesulfobacteriota bacterium]
MNAPTQNDARSPRLTTSPSPDYDLDRAVKDISEEDETAYLDLVSTSLLPEQTDRILNPERTFPKQKEVLAIHWHPEWIPLNLIEKRLQAVFPHQDKALIIPTQHNAALTLGEYAGVEMDCFAAGFNRKVQLLLHFKAEKMARADVLRSMLEHTFKYRSRQLFEFMDSIINQEHLDRLTLAAAQTGANAEVTALTRFYTARLRRLIMDHEAVTPPEMIKNKLVPEWLQAQRRNHSEMIINRALLLVQAVKEIVKRQYSLDYFFQVTEVIEEARGLGGGVVIPHPEQFWPILLADYDVDGWEVWNPQSQEYTEFLIHALNHQNKLIRSGRRHLLVFMGDDTHMSVKIRNPSYQEPAKLVREVGFQPAWDDPRIRKSLSLVRTGRAKVIDQYKERLG